MCLCARVEGEETQTRMSVYFSPLARAVEFHKRERSVLEPARLDSTGSVNCPLDNGVAGLENGDKSPTSTVPVLLSE